MFRNLNAYDPNSEDCVRTRDSLSLSSANIRDLSEPQFLRAQLAASFVERVPPADCPSLILDQLIGNINATSSQRYNLIDKEISARGLSDHCEWNKVVDRATLMHHDYVRLISQSYEKGLVDGSTDVLDKNRSDFIDELQYVLIYMDLEEDESIHSSALRTDIISEFHTDVFKDCHTAFHDFDEETRANFYTARQFGFHPFFLAQIVSAADSEEMEVNAEDREKMEELQCRKGGALVISKNRKLLAALEDREEHEGVDI